ncbi:MAG: hypothetical protein Q8L64_04975 [bacterium]|nr:hypothetical protein [bacterium]
MRIDETIDKVTRVSIRTVIKVLRMRPSSAPFISGDGFRSLADHIFETGQSFDPNDIKIGDLVYVQSDLVNKYFSEMHPKIRSKYVLLTHNSDANIGEKEASFMDSNIVHWFAQNVVINHPRITPIPIGLENLSFVGNGRPWLYKKAAKKSVSRNGRLIACFSVATNPNLRSRILKTVLTDQKVDVRDYISPQSKYLHTLKTYSGVVSPPGNGEDCCRTWEALYVGTVPYVARSPLTERFVNFGIPLVIVDDWSSLPLVAIHETIDVIPAIWMDFWKKLVRNAQDEARNTRDIIASS